MILMKDTDSTYLVLPASLSRITVHCYFTNHMPDYYKVTLTSNGPISTECKTLKTVVYYSSKAETGGTFENEKNVTPL